MNELTLFWSFLSIVLFTYSVFVLVVYRDIFGSMFFSILAAVAAFLWLLMSAL
ncbi:hypothetical protein HUG10_20965 (plasmid) [Halorarum halophilum]|uniref:Uncharacterized protein n=1 Tax=Halorarum halophilum TaxID=2743090 RepID=A0A7D5KAS0_9EURY|nr:hypothetical protein [Halobaculum halophilum]QLG30059.1 hypothetical protein HUG10_20965 [Halobaculum halophilum]